jgi:hypothetical protein
MTVILASIQLSKIEFISIHKTFCTAFRTAHQVIQYISKEMRFLVCLTNMMEYHGLGHLDREPHDRSGG